MAIKASSLIGKLGSVTKSDRPAGHFPEYVGVIRGFNERGVSYRASVSLSDDPSAYRPFFGDDWDLVIYSPDGDIRLRPADIEFDTENLP